MKSSILTLDRVWTKTALFLFFLSMAILAPFIKIQLITGTIVNMVLFLSVSLLGIEAGVLLGFMPSIVSGFVGFAPLTPFIPYIIASNAILAVSFGLIGKKWGFVPAGLAKFGFLCISSYFMVIFVGQPGLPPAMLWLQIATALGGGTAAHFLLRRI
ncbi:MAG: hypothetical protein A2365_03010 [Candidatus Nealsonbacteria bacterium RIFOXYB1_FULL_40_15]|uniref:ECF transporter S component n=2 Tax=Candidatus Nealsoniibacteriota TaxID=1817911 RepID=A0A1G2EVA2_9BACT|nr:MAG: hypothetical protein A2365_03010 [Candidatus Nealsonbacteria bacterium RIFOXYB1_FULL_40_15]OGZ29198.1 MAG: hypothetical protein A2427_02865 [Candidatus Nealsonbacteria bacterium RIFOXYC1_FULL_40_7]